MASPQASEKLSGKIAVTQYDHDPADSTVATDVAWVDMRDAEHFMALTFASALTGLGVTAFTILANAASDGTGTDVTIKEHAVGTAPDAVGDYLMLECTAEEIAQEGSDAGVANLRYVTANLTCANAADEQVVTYIRAGRKRAYDALTADVIA